MTKRETNILKCVAILMMFAHHLFLYADQTDYPAIAYGLLLSTPGRLAAFGQLCKLCVTIFVFATAYGTAKSYKTDSMADHGAMMALSTRRWVKLMISFQFVYIIAFALCPLGGKRWFTLYSPSRLENLVFAFFDFMGISYIIGTPSYNSAWWYMSLAVTFIFIMPLLIKLCRRYGFFVLLPEILLVRWLNVEWVIYRYLLPAVVGTLMAEYDVIEKGRETYAKARLPIKCLVYVGLFAGLALGSVLWLRAGDELLDIYETILLLLTVFLALLTVARIPGISNIAEFIGKHSMNMYFFHAFIYQNWFYNFTYSLRYPALIFLFLLASTLMISIVIERMKKRLRIGRLVDLVSDKLCALLLPKRLEKSI